MRLQLVRQCTGTRQRLARQCMGARLRLVSQLMGTRQRLARQCLGTRQFLQLLVVSYQNLRHVFYSFLAGLVTDRFLFID